MHSMSNLFALFRPIHVPFILYANRLNFYLLQSNASDFVHAQPFRFPDREEKIPRNCITFTLSMNREFFFTVQNFLIARLTPMVEARGGHPI